jgi:CDP-diacylglycerol---glycerol-3-phosphate 3-phosphatidyltransferase
MASSPEPKPPQTLSDWLRVRTAQLSAVVGGALHRAGVHPDAVTLAGLVVVGVGAVLIGVGRLTLAGWVIALASLLDAADGAVARARGEVRPFGAVLDSTLDRYADGFIFLSLSYHLASQNKTEWMLLPLAALVGSFAVSYVRARAASPDVGVAVKIGLFTRFERLAVIVVALWLHPWLLMPGLWLLAAGTNITAAQRLWFVRRHTGVS